MDGSGNLDTLEQLKGRGKSELYASSEGLCVELDSGLFVFYAFVLIRGSVRSCTLDLGKKTIILSLY